MERAHADLARRFRERGALMDAGAIVDDVEQDCAECDGSGECLTCDGFGNFINEPEDCGRCAGTGTCQTCGGSGDA